MTVIMREPIHRAPIRAGAGALATITGTAAFTGPTGVFTATGKVRITGTAAFAGPTGAFSAVGFVTGAECLPTNAFEWDDSGGFWIVNQAKDLLIVAPHTEISTGSGSWSEESQGSGSWAEESTGSGDWTEECS